MYDKHEKCNKKSECKNTLKLKNNKDRNKVCNRNNKIESLTKGKDCKKESVIYEAKIKANNQRLYWTRLKRNQETDSNR